MLQFQEILEKQNVILNLLEHKSRIEEGIARYEVLEGIGKVLMKNLIIKNLMVFNGKINQLKGEMSPLKVPYQISMVFIDLFNWAQEESNKWGVETF